MITSLITGGAGFIGSHLAERLLAEGHRVLVVDDLSTGRFDNIAHLKGHERFEYFIDTIANEGLLAELVDRADWVYHLAAAVGVMLIVERPVSSIETNIHGTELVLRMAAKKNKRVLITSSSEVYGKGAKVPFSEEDDCVLGPTVKARWSYACSKAIDEFLALAYHRERSLPVIVVRLFNTVGPRQVGRYGMVVPRFVRQALSGGPITVFGDGRQTRCFCHVRDVVEALLSLMRTDSALGQVFNVGSNEEIAIRDLAERIRALVGGNIQIVHVPYNEAYEAGFEDLRRRTPDLTKIRNLIDFKPSVGLDEILRTMVQSMREEAGKQ
jgi:UDP-glucose 4-epimerase